MVGLRVGVVGLLELVGLLGLVGLLELVGLLGLVGGVCLQGLVGGVGLLGLVGGVGVWMESVAGGPVGVAVSVICVGVVAWCGSGGWAEGAV